MGREDKIISSSLILTLQVFSSLEVFDGSGDLTFNNRFVFVHTSPVFSDELLVFFLGDVQLLELVVLIGVQFLDFSRLGGSSPDPETADIVVSFITIDTVDGKSVLSEVFKSLEETVHEVVGQEEDLTFTFGLYVVDLPDGETVGIEVLEEEVAGFVLVFGIDEKGLEVEEVEVGGGEEVKGVLFLFLGGFFLGGFLLGGGGLLLGFFLLLFFLLGLGKVIDFDSLGGHEESTEFLGEGFLGHKVFVPSGDVGDELSVLFVEDQSETSIEGGGNADISNGDLVSGKVGVDLKDIIQLLQELSELAVSSLDFILGESSTDVLSASLVVSHDEFSVRPVEPLVNEGFFNEVSTIETLGLVKSGEESEDGVGFEDEFAFGGFEDGEFASGVLGQEFLGLELVISGVDDFSLDTSEVGGNDSLSGEEKIGGGVDFVHFFGYFR